MKPCLHEYQHLMNHKIKCYLKPMKPRYEIKCGYFGNIRMKHSTGISLSNSKFGLPEIFIGFFLSSVL